MSGVEQQPAQNLPKRANLVAQSRALGIAGVPVVPANLVEFGRKAPYAPYPRRPVARVNEPARLRARRVSRPPECAGLAGAPRIGDWIAHGLDASIQFGEPISEIGQAAPSYHFRKRKMANLSNS